MVNVFHYLTIHFLYQDRHFPSKYFGQEPKNDLVLYVYIFRTLNAEIILGKIKNKTNYTTTHGGEVHT